MAILGFFFKGNLYTKALGNHAEKSNTETRGPKEEEEIGN